MATGTAISNTFENRMLDWVNFVGTPTRPSGVWVALHTADPGETGSLAAEVTTSGTAYARQSVTFGTAASGAASNTNTITFAVATANYGTLSHFSICDASSAGNVIWYGPLTTGTGALNTGGQFTFAIGALTLNLD